MTNWIGTQDYDYTLAAGERMPIPAVGKFISCTSADYPFKVSLNNGLEFTIQRGLSFELPFGQFDEIAIINGAIAQKVKVYVGDVIVRDSRFSLSDQVVSTIDGRKEAVREGHCFVGEQVHIGVSNKYTMAQLWNPVGSGYNLWLSRLLWLNFSNAAVPFMADSVPELSTGDLTYAKNKVIGGAVDTVAKMYSWIDESIPTAAQRFLTLYGEQRKTLFFSFEHPVLIPPGKGVIVVESGVVNTNVNNTWEYELEPIL